MKRTGAGAVEIAVALLVVAVGLVPLFESLRADVAAVRPKEIDVAVANLAGDLMERVAVRPRLPDPVRISLEKGAILEGPALQAVIADLGGLPSDVVSTITQASTRLEVVRHEWRASARLDPGVAQPAPLEVWVIKACWKDGPHDRSRSFVRASAQG